MKLPGHANKWGSAVLGVVSLLLVVNLVAQYRAMQPAGKYQPAVAAGAGNGPAVKATGLSRATSDLTKYDPQVHLEALKAQDSRPLPDEDRNPFEFVGGAPSAPAPLAAAAPVAPAPPPPPPPPLKAIGYNELPNGEKDVMISYNDDVVVAHEGDMIGSKFKLVKVDPSKVVVEDESTHKTIELPIPQ